MMFDALRREDGFHCSLGHFPGPGSCRYAHRPSVLRVALSQKWDRRNGVCTHIPQQVRGIASGTASKVIEPSASGGTRPKAQVAGIGIVHARH